MGASFGNGAVWVNTKNTGAIERVYCNDHGQSAIGAITTRYAIKGNSLDPRDPDAAQPEYISLLPDGPLRTFELHPAFQRVTFTIGTSTHVQETTFVPLENIDVLEPPAAFQIVEVRNDHPRAQDIRFLAFARLRGSLPEDVVVDYDDRLHVFSAYNASQPRTVRFFGLQTKPTSCATTFAFDKAYDPGQAPTLDGSTGAQGDVLAAFQVDMHLRPGETRSLTLVAAAYAVELSQAVKRYCDIPSSETALKRTIAHLESILVRSRLLSPDPVLNDGSVWSKVNMRRVMARFPQGSAFTNDPGNTPNVVVRDAAWFVYGNDHFMPDFSRRLLDKIVEMQYPSGKLPEYFDGITGAIEDDGLNINDDTPLFVLAVNHHFRSTGDQDWLENVYASVAKAARYILSQRDDRGLVFCTSRDPRGGVWGIAGWRNIIPDYRINGAVTEINAECVAALRAAGHLASETDHAQESREFFEHSVLLRQAMDRHLVNPSNGLYYLNIDVDGNKHGDVTGDLIFPVMFRACDEEIGFRIISRLNASDFSTPAGLRTASCNDPRYDPSAYSGLVGGVWPGLTWWYAFAAAKYHPNAMVNALRSSFEHYASNPRKNNTLPGQFSEWFDGEALTNKGMRLSPWEPPRFMWAAVEGVCGLMLGTGAPRITPLIPNTWKWLALSNVPYHGRSFSYLLARQDTALHLYSTLDVDSDLTKELFEEDVSHRMDALSETTPFMALRRADEVLIFVGNVGVQTCSVPLDLRGLVKAHPRYVVTVFDSERGAWQERLPATSRDLRSLAISIEAHGFRLIRLQPV